MTKRIVVALGGNAILTDDPSAEAQQTALQQTAKYLVNFLEMGDVQLVLTHGNGPQVGNLVLQQLDHSTQPKKQRLFVMSTQIGPSLRTLVAATVVLCHLQSQSVLWRRTRFERLRKKV